MIEFRCTACEALAYSSVPIPNAEGCPACGADLEEIAVGARAQPSPREPQPEELLPPYASPVAMNASVTAVRAAEGLRAPS